MFRKYFFLSAALFMLSAVTVMAQNEEKSQLDSYNFVEIQGGAQFTATDMAIDKLINPMAGISIGRFFTPAVGLRLNASGWEGKSGFKLGNEEATYKWKYLTSDIDLMLNLSNLICKNYERALNLMLIGGVGLTTAWDNNEAIECTKQLSNGNAWDGTKLLHNIRAGLRLETNVTKPLGVSLEVLASSLGDRWNSKYSNKDDWQFSAAVGLVYRFGHKYKKNQEPVVETVVPVVEEEPAPVVVEPKEEKPTPVVVEPKPTQKPVVTEPEKLHEEKFYEICQTDNLHATQMNRIKAYMDRNPDAKIRVVGYADKGTGNPRINKRYAKERAKNFKDTLIKDYNCDGSRIIVDSKGDVVQPFAENDKNRCVIVDGPVK